MEGDTKDSRIWHESKWYRCYVWEVDDGGWCIGSYEISGKNIYIVNTDSHGVFEGDGTQVLSW